MEQDTIEVLNKRLDQIAIEHASRQPIEDMIRLLLYVIFGISIFLGAFGITQFSVLDNMLEEKIALQFAQDDARVLAYKNSVNELRIAHAEYSELISEYAEAIKNLSYLREVDGTLDLEPTVYALSDEGR